MDKVFHYSDVKTGTPTKWKTSQATESPLFTRDSYVIGDICHLIPILLISSRKELSLQNFHTVEEGTPQVITGAFKLTYNRGHYTRLHHVEQLITYQGQQANNHSTQDPDQTQTCCVRLIPTTKVPQTNFMRSTTCLTPHPRWQGYRTFWPTKDVTEDSSHHMDLTSDEWEAATSMKYHMKGTQEFLMPPTKRIVHNNS